MVQVLVEPTVLWKMVVEVMVMDRPLDGLVVKVLVKMVVLVVVGCHCWSACVGHRRCGRPCWYLVDEMVLIVVLVVMLMVEVVAS